MNTPKLNSSQQRLKNQSVDLYSLMVNKFMHKNVISVINVLCDLYVLQQKMINAHGG